MKKLVYLFSLLLLLGCDSLNEEPEIVICPMGGSMVDVFTVDYTTNKFLGGYTVGLPVDGQPFAMECEYRAPGDFGSVAWYDKVHKKELFSGTIVWMGSGKRTFPENISSPADFVKLDLTTAMPNLIPLCHDVFDTSVEGVDYAPIWQAIADLQNVSWVGELTLSYIYLYRPSVGLGDPKEWYWVVFLKH